MSAPVAITSKEGRRDINATVHAHDTVRSARGILVTGSVLIRTAAILSGQAVREHPVGAGLIRVPPAIQNFLPASAVRIPIFHHLCAGQKDAGYSGQSGSGSRCAVAFRTDLAEWSAAPASHQRRETTLPVGIGSI